MREHWIPHLHTLWRISVSLCIEGVKRISFTTASGEFTKNPSALGLTGRHTHHMQPHRNMNGCVLSEYLLLLKAPASIDPLSITWTTPHAASANWTKPADITLWHYMQCQVRLGAGRIHWCPQNCLIQAEDLGNISAERFSAKKPSKGNGKTVLKPH